MDGFKVGSARIYQLFANSSQESSVRQDSTAKSATTEQQSAQNTDAVKISASVQQEVSQRQSKLEELKQKIQSGQYQKTASSTQTAKSIIEFYSA